MSNIFFQIYALLLIVGGILGWKKAGSKPSLIAGCLSGLLVFALLHFSQTNFQAAYIGLIVLGVILEMVFTVRFLKTRKPMPSLVLSFLSLVSIVVSVLALQGIIR